MTSSSGGTPSSWGTSRPTERRRPTWALLLALFAVTSSCSDDGPALTDGGLDLQGWIDGDIADLLPLDDAAALPDRCDPSTALTARVDPARMLKDLQFLVGLGERWSHASQMKAAAYLKAELAKLPGFQVKEHSYSYQGQTYVNLEATLPGSDLADQMILSGAHYDSTSESPTTSAPGADDNASGAAMVLGAARVLAGCQPRRTIRLLLFSNEEKGVIGSTAYVQSIKASLPKEKLIGFINVDMVGFGPDNDDLELVTRPAYKTFVDQMGAAVEQWTTLEVRKIVGNCI
jgi:hypothetical protein